jgi:hypothetical protein
MKHSDTQGALRRSKTLLFSIAWVLAAGLAVGTPGAFAQQLTGTISGTVYDQAGAVVPHANILLKNEASGDVRTAETDGAGHFTITAVQPAQYDITVSAPGFSGWEENSIVMNQGDSRDVPGIRLKMGGVSTQVDVVGGGDVTVPTDTAEISTSLNEQMINDFPLQGRDAGELLKIMPGMALNNGGSQGSSFNDKVVGSNNGPVGAYSSNGTQPNGTMAFMLDGANLVDPGNFGTQIANINQDMVSNVKVLMSNYGAEYAKGPVIFQAFSKSGGQKFHGEGYLYNHNSVLNSVDAYSKSQGLTNAAESYYYIGGNVGGPVILPFVHFNQDRKKLFFWAGYEYMKQKPAATPINYNVPTTNMLNGDFTFADATSITPLSQLQNAWPHFYSALSQNLPAGATATNLPVADFDPNIGGVLGLYPKTNLTPDMANGYNNYQYVNQSPQNRWEATGKVDYAISDNTKLTGSYSYQKENDLAPISVWWSAPWTLPTPSPAQSNTVTYIILTNLTHVFNPTTTNEAVFTWSHFVNPYALTNPSADSRTTNNFNVPGLFGNTTKQIPNFEGSWGGNIANISSYPFSPGSFGGKKEVPAFYDNFTKLVGDHTLKVGFYWDESHNFQNSNSPDNGTYNVAYYSQYSTANEAADVMLGRIAQYQQQNQDVVSDTKFHQVSIYAQDQWKAGKHLTLNYGLRFDHIGQWYGFPKGMQVWDPASYDNSANAAANTGILYHAIDSKIPVSGFKSPLFYWAPRVGIAYDIFGTGKTVFRGGFAVYRYQATSETASAGNGPAGSFEYGTPTAFEGYANVTAFTPPSSVAQNGSSIYVMQQGDDRAPFTNDWNATISQALPWRSVMEVSYVGNRSANEYMDGSNGKLFDLNNIPTGGLFKADPKTGQYVSPSQPSCGGSNPSLYCLTQNYPTFNTQDFRPLNNYQDVYLLTHAPWSNYESLQVSFAKQSGPVTFQTNYTFGKVLGVRDGGSNNGPGNGTAVDPFSLRNNYGPLAYDHTHILNLTYNWRLPKPIHGDGLGMHLAAGAVNGWQLSGYTTWQSGAPMQPGLGGNFNANYAGNLTTPTVQNPNLPDNSFALPNGLRATSISTSTYFGTNVGVLVPALTCDPRKGLKSGQRFNPNCFTTPAIGTNGPTDLPYVRYPNYFDSDLGIYKSFQVREGQRVEFRASATNWLNHPLRQFGLAGNSDQSLNFQTTTNATCTGCVTTSYDSKGNLVTTPIQVTSVSPTNTNTSTTGTPAFKVGSRFVTLALKYYF